MFVVTGASGNIGKRITEMLLSEGKKVKVVGRHREKMAELEKKGAEVVVGDLADAALLTKAFAGAEGVFAMLPTNLAAEDLKAYQDKTGEAIAKALADSGVKHVVSLSSLGAHLPSGNGPIAGLHRQEQRLNAIKDLNVLHLRAAFFMENTLNGIGMIKGMGIYGSPMRGDLKIPQIATQDIAAHAAMRLLKKDFKGKEVQELMGKRDLSMEESTSILGKAIGKPDLRYVQFPYEDALKAMVGMGISQSVAESFVEMNKGFNEGTLGKPTRSAANTTSTGMEEFAPVFAAAYNAGNAGHG
jgi:uncharacterized protein YbjT (DUF2867 family)